MKELVELRIPTLSRDLLKDLQSTFTAPTMLEVVKLDQRELAFRAGARYVVEAIAEGIAADDAEATTP